MSEDNVLKFRAAGEAQRFRPVTRTEYANALRTIELVDRYAKGQPLDRTPVADRVIRQYGLED